MTSHLSAVPPHELHINTFLSHCVTPCSVCLCPLYAVNVSGVLLYKTTRVCDFVSLSLRGCNSLMLPCCAKIAFLLGWINCNGCDDSDVMLLPCNLRFTIFTPESYLYSKHTTTYVYLHAHIYLVPMLQLHTPDNNHSWNSWNAQKQETLLLHETFSTVTISDHLQKHKSRGLQILHLWCQLHCGTHNHLSHTHHV